MAIYDYIKMKNFITSKVRLNRIKTTNTLEKIKATNALIPLYKELTQINKIREILRSKR